MRSLGACIWVTSQLPVVPRLYQVSNAYSYSTTPIAVSSLPIQSHPPLLENLIFFGKIAGIAGTLFCLVLFKVRPCFVFCFCLFFPYRKIRYVSLSALITGFLPLITTIYKARDPFLDPRTRLELLGKLTGSKSIFTSKH